LKRGAVAGGKGEQGKEKKKSEAGHRREEKGTQSQNPHKGQTISYHEVSRVDERRKPHGEVKRKMKQEKKEREKSGVGP